MADLGVGGLFVLNAPIFAMFAVALLTAPTPEATVPGSAGFLAGLEAGGRYVRNAPSVRRIFLRLDVFAAPTNILWALLPLVARQPLGMGATCYGLLLGAAGVGAVLGAVPAWVRARARANVPGHRRSDPALT